MLEENLSWSPEMQYGTRFYFEIPMNPWSKKYRARRERERYWRQWSWAKINNQYSLLGHKDTIINERRYNGLAVQATSDIIHEENPSVDSSFGNAFSLTSALLICT